MLRPLSCAALLTTALSLAPAPATATPETLPEIDGVPALASVNGEPLTLAEYLDALGEMHAELEEAGSVVPKRDPLDLLERLVNGKLILQEARAIGLDEQPEFRKSLEQFREDLLRQALFAHVTRELGPPPAAEVDLAYRGKVEELELASVRFKELAEAEAFRAALADGADFSDLAARLVAESRAEKSDPPTWMKRADVLPIILASLEGLDGGQVSAPIELPQGVGVVRVVSRRYPDDPAAREAAEREVAGARRAGELRSYVDGLREKRLKVDKDLLASLDFDAEAAEFDKFLKDERVVATIEGAEPILVRDLARSTENRLYHGVEQAARKKRVAKTRDNVLEQLTTEALIRAEAIRLGLDKGPDFERQMSDFEESVLFGAFVGRVIDPSVEVKPEELAAAYERDRARYTEPEMVRLDSITFADAASAERGFDRLRAGADFGWMRENAEGLVEDDATPDVFRFSGQLVTTDSLPPEVRDALAGAERGSLRLWAERPDRQHLIVVRDKIEARPVPLDSVRDEIGGRVFGEKRAAALHDWTDKLRQASEIEVFVDADRLRALATEAAGRGPG